MQDKRVRCVCCLMNLYIYMVSDCLASASAWFSAASLRLGLVNAASASVSVSWKLPYPHHWILVDINLQSLWNTMHKLNKLRN